jgi:zinc protease
MTHVLGLLLLVGAAEARAPVAEPIPVVSTDLAAKLPVDPRVRLGTLPNGLRWFVEPNDKPKDRVELRLVVKAGSLLEDDDQRGIAHFVEHMAFNGTRHFPGNDLVAYLESLGAQFGAHLNAYTSFDETVYQLQIPTDRPGAWESGLLVLSDFAGGVLFEDEECERERGVVLEEWRLGQGLAQRAQDASLPVLFRGSRYLDRLPIGTGDSLGSLTCEAARRFWRDWYRPDLMAVAVVGAVDPAKAESLVKERFGALAAPGAPRARARWKVPDHEGTLGVVFQDAELPQPIVSLGARVDEVEGDTHGHYRHFLLEQMLFGVLNERLGVLSQSPDAPFLAAEASEGALGHERAFQVVAAVPKAGRVGETVQALAREVARLRRYGTTAAELGRARDAMSRNLQSYYDERDKTESREHIEEILRVFLTDEPMPGIPYEYALSRAFLPTISLDEANALARGAFFPESSRVVQALLPAREVAPTEAELVALVDAVAAEAISPPDASEVGSALMASPPEPGTVRLLHRDRRLGTSTWRLGNGATVVLKPTAFQNDEVVLEAFSPGGLSRISDADLVPGITASAIAQRSGLGDLSLVDVARLLAGKVAGVSVGLGRTFEVVSGRSSATDLETLLQLLHLQIARPRFDATAFRLEQQGRREAISARPSSPDALFDDRFNDVVWGHDRRMTAWTPADVEAMDLARSEALFRERFGNAGDFTFVLVGNVDEARVLPLVARYLATLPDDGRRETWVDDGARRVEGVHEVELSRGDTPRARYRLLFHGPFVSTPASRLLLEATAAVLETELMADLREARGGTYGVTASATTTEAPVGTYAIAIEFECDPGRLDELVAATREIVEAVRETLPSEALLATMREKNLRRHETRLRENGPWASSLAVALGNGEDPRTILAFPANNARITPHAVRDLARRVLDPSRHVEGVLTP